ncbi:MAG: hypothetical protein GDA49_00215 [Rhodospirillales bacterium]|nr:hypothetical protein [Rhodospirillales bacterium]
MENTDPVVKFLTEIGVELNNGQKQAVTGSLCLKKSETLYFEAVVREMPASTRLPRQAEVCFKALAKAESPLDLEQWGVAATKEGLKTKQDPADVCRFYKQWLINVGLIQPVISGGASLPRPKKKGKMAYFEAVDEAVLAEAFEVVESKGPYFEAAVREMPASTRLPRQAEVCFTALTKATSPLDFEQWAQAALAEGLDTEQEPVRICAYYKKRLIDEGLIRQVKQAFKAAVKDIPANVKLPPQAVNCFTALAKAKGPLDYEQWAQAALAEGLYTTQEPVRICKYYKKRLIDKGLIRKVILRDPSLPCLKKKGKPPYFEAIVEEIPAGIHLPLQAEVCFKALAKAKGPLDYEQWAQAAVEEGLITTHEPVLICKYYKKRLIDKGLIREVEYRARVPCL